MNQSINTLYTHTCKICNCSGNGTFTRVILSGIATWIQPSGTSASASAQDQPMLMPVVSSMRVAVDRSCSGGASMTAQNHSQGGEVDLPPSGVLHSHPSPFAAPGAPSASAPPPWGRDPWGAPNISSATEGQPPPLLPLHLAVWVDHSVVEVFAMGGHGRITSRIYPLGSTVAWGVSVWARCPLTDVNVVAEVYEVDSAWL